MWWKAYESLDLLGGRINYICDDDEDMIEIRYNDGMLIDVGKCSFDSIYYISIVPSDDKNGWKNILEEIPVSDKKDLYDKIQEIILKYRR